MQSRTSPPRPLRDCTPRPAVTDHRRHRRPRYRPTRPRRHSPAGASGPMRAPRRGRLGRRLPTSPRTTCAVDSTRSRTTRCRAAASASSGNFKTTTYIASEFKRLGLKPAGDSGTYFQNLPYGTLKVDSTVARLIAPGHRRSPGANGFPRPARPDLASPTTRTSPTRRGLRRTMGRHQRPRSTRARFAERSPCSPTRRRAAGGGGGARRVGTVRDQRASNAGAALILVASTDSTPRAIVSSAFATRPGCARASRTVHRPPPSARRSPRRFSGGRSANSLRRDGRPGERELDQPVHARRSTRRETSSRFFRARIRRARASTCS